MSLFRNCYSVYILALIFIFSCKASQDVSTAEEKTDDEDVSEGVTYSSSDIIMVDKELKDKLEGYFELFAKMDQGDVATRDSKMEEVFDFFDSPDTPVYLVLYSSDGKRHYDKPMSITDYLYYLYDTQQSPHTVRTLRLDETQTKILRVELAVKQ